MEELENTDSYSTETHSDEIDYIFDKEHENIDDIVWENKDLAYMAKSYFRFLRKKFSSKVREKMQKNFTNVLFLTLDCPGFSANSIRDDNPLEFISEMRNQYPDNDIRVLVPIINLEEDSKFSKKIFSLFKQLHLNHPLKNQLGSLQENNKTYF